jgi:hypothetical protein
VVEKLEKASDLKLSIGIFFTCLVFLTGVALSAGATKEQVRDNTKSLEKIEAEVKELNKRLQNHEINHSSDKYDREKFRREMLEELRRLSEKRKNP